MTFKDFVGNGTNGITGVMSSVIVPAIFALAFVVFVWGVVKYFFLHGGEDAARAEGRSFILWGILGMVVLFTVWGMVRILLSTFGLA